MRSRSRFTCRRTRSSRADSPNRPAWEADVSPPSTSSARATSRTSPATVSATMSCTNASPNRLCSWREARPCYCVVCVVISERGGGGGGGGGDDVRQTHAQPRGTNSELYSPASQQHKPSQPGNCNEDTQLTPVARATRSARMLAKLEAPSLSRPTRTNDMVDRDTKYWYRSRRISTTKPSPACWDRRVPLSSLDSLPPPRKDAEDEPTEAPLRSECLSTWSLAALTALLRPGLACIPRARCMMAAAATAGATLRLVVEQGVAIHT